MSKSMALPVQQFAPINRLPELARVLFTQIGEDPNREGLQRTPERFAKAMLELTEGYAMSGLEAIGEGIFKSESSGPVSVRDIEFFSLCEHHVLPFWGKVSVAYLPDQKIIGLSKIGRLVDVFAKRLQVQERLTTQVGECLRDVVLARAVMVKIEAQHMCMMMRGVGKISSSTRTEFQWQGNDVTTEEMNRLIAMVS